MSNRIEFLSRRNKGRQLLHEYIHALSDITGVDANTLQQRLLDLESSDLIYRQYISDIISINNGSYTDNFFKFSFEESDKMLSITQIDTLPISKAEKFYLVTKNSEFCGLIEIDFDVAINQFDKIIAYDGDSLGLVSAHANTGVMIDMHVDANGRNCYDFIAYFHP